MRLKLILFLLIVSLFFTFCDRCGPFEPIETPTGLEGVSSSIVTRLGKANRYDSLLVYLKLNYSFAQEIPQLKFIESAYACSPPEPIWDARIFIDSMAVSCTPEYNRSSFDDVLVTRTGKPLSEVQDINDVFQYDIIGQLYLGEPPLSADSFRFSFYYFKEGQLIDSSVTQNYFIRYN